MVASAPGERVRTLRELLGLTQVRLAEVAGLNQSWLSEVETGNREAEPEQLQSIPSSTGTPLGFFLCSRQRFRWILCHFVSSRQQARLLPVGFMLSMVRAIV